MTELLVTIGAGFVILALVIHSAAHHHRRNQEAMSSSLHALVREFDTLKISIHRLEGLASKELQSRIDAQEAAERDRRRLADAELRQAIADGKARVLDG